MPYKAIFRKIYYTANQIQMLSCRTQLIIRHTRTMEGQRRIGPTPSLCYYYLLQNKAYEAPYHQNSISQCRLSFNCPRRAWCDTATTTHHAVYSPGSRLFRQIISTLSRLAACQLPPWPNCPPIPIWQRPSQPRALAGISDALGQHVTVNLDYRTMVGGCDARHYWRRCNHLSLPLADN